MQKTNRDSLMVQVPLPGGRVARVPLAVLESYHVEGLKLAHDLAASLDDVTAHGTEIDQATGTNVWHTDAIYGPCEFTDENGYHHSTVALHCHPFGTDYTEILSQ